MMLRRWSHPVAALSSLLLPLVMLPAGVRAADSSAVAGKVASPSAAATKVYRIMPLGDSITRGGGEVRGTYLGYRTVLQADLKAGATGFKDDFVGSMSDKGAPDRNHEGHGGWTIDDLSVHIDAWMQTYRPDIVLLHAGTNNITVGDSPALAAEKLQGLIAQIRAAGPDTLIFVAKVVFSRSPERQPVIGAYEALIPGVVARAGAQVYLVDQSSVAGTDIYDHTHPNAFGYSKMAFNWYHGMRRVLDTTHTWRSVTNPYRARTATICQIRYDLGGQRICGRRTVN